MEQTNQILRITKKLNYFKFEPSYHEQENCYYIATLSAAFKHFNSNQEDQTGNEINDCTENEQKVSVESQQMNQDVAACIEGLKQLHERAKPVKKTSRRRQKTIPSEMKDFLVADEDMHPDTQKRHFERPKPVKHSNRIKPKSKLKSK